MRTCITILFFLVLRIGYSQNTSPSPFKGATTITITTNDSGENLYKRFEKHLTLKGYRVGKKDTAFPSLRTESQQLSKHHYSYIINATVDKSNVIVTMDWRDDNPSASGANASSFSRWDYQTGKKEVREIIFDDLMGRLISFPKASVSYSR